MGMLACVPVWSQDTNPETEIKIGEAEVPLEPQQGGDPVPLVSTWDFVRMVLVLASVVGAIYLLFFLLKRTTGVRRTENDLIRVLDYQGLSGSRGLYLVEVGVSVYLVGSADNAVSLVAEVTDKESLDAVRLALEQGGTQEAPRSFVSVLSGLFGGAAGGGAGTDNVSYLRKQKERLRKLQ
jgi:flagellar protein FliO/FliZ